MWKPRGQFRPEGLWEPLTIEGNLGCCQSKGPGTGWPGLGRSCPSSKSWAGLCTWSRHEKGSVVNERISTSSLSTCNLWSWQVSTPKVNYVVWGDSKSSIIKFTEMLSFSLHHSLTVETSIVLKFLSFTFLRSEIYFIFYKSWEGKWNNLLGT